MSSPTNEDKTLAHFDRRPMDGKRVELRIAISEFEGKYFIHLREWVQIGKKRWIPTKLGCTIRPYELKDAIRALQKAQGATVGKKPIEKPSLPEKHQQDLLERLEPEYRAIPPWEDWPDDNAVEEVGVILPRTRDGCVSETPCGNRPASPERSGDVRQKDTR